METTHFDLANRSVKIMRVEKVEKFGDRYFPVKTVVQNGFKKSYITIFEMIEVQFDIKIDPSLFNKSSLYD